MTMRTSQTGSLGDNQSGERTLHQDSKYRDWRRFRARSPVWIGAVLLLCLLAAAWVGFRGYQIHSGLTSGKDLALQLSTELTAGDDEGASRTFALLRQETAQAREAGSDPLWRAAGTLPVFGGNFVAATEITVSADDIVNGALGPLIDEVHTLDWEDLAPVDGGVDLAPIRRMAPHLVAAATTVELSHMRLRDIDSSALLPQIEGALTEIDDVLASAGDTLGDAAVAAELVPAMLGATEPRNHLLLIQNPAEIRATGGIPGALAVMRAEAGQIKLTEHGSASEMGLIDPPVPVDPKQTLIYSDRLGRYMQSVNLTPDFPTAARTASRMWEGRGGESQIHGVIAIDPIVLAHILEATGPVELAFEDPLVQDVVSSSALPTSLTSENVVPTLLSDVYAAIEEPSVQDAYFAAVAGQVFTALTSGSGEGSGLMKALVRSADEGRLYVWSAIQEEQSIITGTALAGGVLGPRSGGAAFGAYFNDGTGAKMDYYVRRTVQLVRGCTAEGYLQYTLRATLTNDVPSDAVDSLPAYVTGGGRYGVPPGTVQTNFVGYGPDQSRLQTARIDGNLVPLGSYRHGERPVGVLTTRLDPGETVVVELDFSNVVQTSNPVLDVTPSIQPVDEVVLPLQAEDVCSR